MRRWLLHGGLLGLAACATLFSPLPPDLVLEAAQPLSDLGHPGGTFRDASIVGSSSGGCGSSGTHDRYVDLAVRYDRRDETHTMTVRMYVHEQDPCRITVDVLDDTGPPPVLLDNPLSAKAVGEELCEALDEARAGPPGRSGEGG